MSPLAYLITWTTYGTWLPGDARGWVAGGTPGIQAGDPGRRQAARQWMAESPVVLDEDQRALVDATIRAHCRIRKWTLHAVNVRSNHAHLVVTSDRDPDTVMEQFKAWCSRKLNEPSATPRRHWWTKGGSTKWINDETYLRNAIRYVLERQ